MKRGASNQELIDALQGHRKQQTLLEDQLEACKAHIEQDLKAIHVRQDALVTEWIVRQLLERVPEARQYESFLQSVTLITRERSECLIEMDGSAFGLGALVIRTSSQWSSYQGASVIDTDALTFCSSGKLKRIKRNLYKEDKELEKRSKQIARKLQELKPFIDFMDTQSELFRELHIEMGLRLEPDNFDAFETK